MFTNMVVDTSYGALMKQQGFKGDSNWRGREESKGLCGPKQAGHFMCKGGSGND